MVMPESAMPDQMGPPKEGLGVKAEFGPGHLRPEEQSEADEHHQPDNQAEQEDFKAVVMPFQCRRLVLLVRRVGTPPTASRSCYPPASGIYGNILT
jgi:hypothetical protein